MNEEIKNGKNILSMTGFGMGSATDDNYKLEIEIKSVNNRYCDINIHIPSNLRQFEPLLLEYLSRYNLRGKIDIYVKFNDNSNSKNQFIVNENMLNCYLKAIETISKSVNLKQEDFSLEQIVQIANYPEILEMINEDIDLEKLNKVLKEAFSIAINNFILMKIKEGENLTNDVLKRIDKIKILADELSSLAPELVDGYRQNLLNILKEELKEYEIDMARVVQETAIYSEKINYTEEVVRLHSHLSQFKQTIDKGGNIGRKLDFIIQEMNREINTASSKANSVKASQIAVDIKSELEKIREQIQNIQ